MHQKPLLKTIESFQKIIARNSNGHAMYYKVQWKNQQQQQQETWQNARNIQFIQQHIQDYDQAVQNVKRGKVIAKEKQINKRPGKLWKKLLKKQYQKSKSYRNLRIAGISSEQLDLTIRHQKSDEVLQEQSDSAPIGQQIHLQEQIQPFIIAIRQLKYKQPTIVCIQKVMKRIHPQQHTQTLFFTVKMSNGDTKEITNQQIKSNNPMLLLNYYEDRITWN